VAQSAQPGEFDTPMMRQYRDAKERYPGTIVLFRAGDFYELFGDDAVLVARILNIALTSRDRTVPMAGFPHHALETHLRKLIQAGHRVAICEQLETAAQAKGLIRREVVRVVTPGTLTEDELLDAKVPNHLLAIAPAAKSVGLAWLELTAGTFYATDVPAHRLADEVGRLNPAECLLPASDAARLSALLGHVLTRPATERPDAAFDPDHARAVLLNHFAVKTVAGFGFEDDQPCVRAAGVLLEYARDMLKASLTHLSQPRVYRSETVLLLDETTRRSLELTRTLRDGSRDGSLLANLDHTTTPMGARLLHDWLLAPLTHQEAIEARLDAVAELVADHAFRQDLRQTLRQCADLQRLTARASTGQASPRDVKAIGVTLRFLPAVKSLLQRARSALLVELNQRLDPLTDLDELIEAAIVDAAPTRLDGHLVNKDGLNERLTIIKPGYNPQLDEYRQLIRDSKSWLASYQAEQITRTGIQGLKLGYNQVFGYYLELTEKQSQIYREQIPKDYRPRQTLKNAQRYVTAELMEYDEKIRTAAIRSQELELELFAEVRARVAEQSRRLLGAAELLATLDVLASLAHLAASRNYCRPQLTDRPVLDIRDGRHPVLEILMPQGTFVPNDVSLGLDHGRFWLVTGPNMAGKSTFLRQVALLTLLAHMGSFIPARSATIGLTDRIFTRVGAGDELSRGQSTFMVEMTEAANILNNASQRSLVVLDEIGRGTSTYDGVSLAWAITEHLHESICCRTLFATHYHELAQLADSLPQLRNYQVQVREQDGEVVFLHKIAPGSTDKSYGIHVARLAGVPLAVIERAESVLASLEMQHRLKTSPPATPNPRLTQPPERLASPTPRRKPPLRRNAPTDSPTLFGGNGEDKAG
jgi:DNA mismatch repair protein MutS